jgi:hypothetical protein
MTMSEVAIKNQAPLPANFGENLMKGIAETRATIIVGGGGKPFLRLLRNGVWVYGPQDVEVQPGSNWAVNLASLSRGWVCWHDGKKLGEVMASVQVPFPPQPQPIGGKEFAEQFGFELSCVSGDDKGVEVIYRNNSDGFKKAFDKLVGELQQQWAADKEYYWPVLSLSEESYTHPRYGLIYKPVMSIVAWANANGEYLGEAPAAPEPAPVATAPKAARQRRAPVAAAEAATPAPAAQAQPAPTQAAHTGQRRRPAAR